MSVRVNERNQGDLTVIVKAKELSLHTIKVTQNENYFPKRYRLTFTDKMVAKSIDIFTLLLEANELYPHNLQEYQTRQAYQRKAMAYCRSLAAMLDIAKELFNLPTKKVEYWIKLIFSVRNLTAAWYNKDRQRFEDKFN